MRKPLSVIIGLALFGGFSGAAPAPEAPRQFQYTCDYFIYDALGKFQNKMQIKAGRVQAGPGGDFAWSQPTIAFGSDLEGPCGTPMPQRYMEGLSYPEADVQQLVTAGFYKGFPQTPLAFLMKNTVVDSHMFDIFTAETDALTLHVPHRSATSGVHVTLFGDQGLQQLKRLDLTWVGDSTIDGTPCRVIQFQSTVDPVTMVLPGGSQVASTVFWGTMWVATKEKRVLSAIMHEHTLTAPPNPEAKIQDVKNIYRMVTFRSRSKEK